MALPEYTDLFGWESYLAVGTIAHPFVNSLYRSSVFVQAKHLCDVMYV